ncbi:LLM class oxidoreductase (plasmid) [Pantoea sp. C3]|uniref:LLM class oxidoreductase n=1 Tax=Pantoea phytostimulans TaxID=2769024 RepID=UPI0038F70A6E
MNLSLPEDLCNHRGFKHVFKPGKLTFGLIAPIEGYALSPFPTMKNHAEMAQLADQGGISSLWIRDVPFFDPRFGDVGQIYDPMVYLGYLASITKNITLGTTGIVSTLRDPLFTAKQAASIDQLSGGRFLLGLSTGDRPVEYPAFNAKFEDRGERYREGWNLIKKVTEEEFPSLTTHHYGSLHGAIDLVPKPVQSRIPMMVVGRAQQSMEWIASNADAWLWYATDTSRIGEVITDFNTAGDGKTFRPYGYSTWFDMSPNPDGPLHNSHGVLRGGWKALISHFKQQEEAGVSHIALNMKPMQRPAKDMLNDLIDHVLPHFLGQE